MRGRLLLLLASISIGCTDEADDLEDRSIPVMLAGTEGQPTVVGRVEHGVVQLDEAFASSFDLALTIDADPQALASTFAEGELVNLLVVDDSEVVDAIPLVIGAHSLATGFGIASCAWQFQTTRYGAACTTMTYWKRSTCSGGEWERYGESTWCRD